MSEHKNIYIAADLATHWAAQCLQKAGAEPVIAASMAEHLVAADLLGFRTHGLMRLGYNVRCLQQGEARGAGTYVVERQRAAMQLWDADYLSGLYVVPQAVKAAIAMAKQCGTGTVVIKRAQHVAALVVYLEHAIHAGMMIQLLCATPGQQVVAPYGAKSAWFSPNPFAIGVPTQSQPILFDISLSMTAAGKVRKAIAEKQPLPYPALITAVGDYTTDATTFMAEPASVLAPLGGQELGYKGSGLCLFSELWTLALSQLGRHQELPGVDANTVWVQVIDPSTFGSLAEFKAQAQALVDGMKAAIPIAPDQPVRVPGEGALRTRERQLRNGIEYTPALWRQLGKVAQAVQVPLPDPNAKVVTV